MQADILLRNVRLASGLVLLVFVVGHLANLAIGLHSLAAMEHWRAKIGRASCRERVLRLV